MDNNILYKHFLLYNHYYLLIYKYDNKELPKNIFHILFLNIYNELMDILYTLLHL